jgi:hypothetical protein
MRIKGHIHRIQDLQQFVLNFLATDGKPTQGFVDWGSARVSCVVLSQSPQVPNSLIEGDADNQGRFTLTINDNLGRKNAFVLIRTQIDTFHQIPGVEIPVFGPVYRSSTFVLNQISEEERGIFVFLDTLPDDQGFPDAEVSSEVRSLRTRLGLDFAHGEITKTDIDVRAKKNGATVRFDIKLYPSASVDLKNFIEVKAKNIDIDLPGPDFITGLCINENDIEKKIRNQVRRLNQIFNDRINKRLPPNSKDIMTCTIRKIRYPITNTQQVEIPGGGLGVPEKLVVQFRSIAGDPCIGFPKKLFP